MNNQDQDWWSILAEGLPLPESIAVGDVPTLNIAFRHLWAELREAQSHFASGNHLTGAYLSVVAVSAFLSLFSPVRQEGLSMPLAALEGALWALDEGVVQPILKPARRARTGRARSSDLYQKLKGTAIYVVHRLHGLGLEQKEVWKMVGAELRQIGLKPDRGSGDITARTIRGWCEKVAADVGSQEAAAQHYYVLLSHPANKALEKMPREVAKSWLLSRLRFFVTTIGAKPPNPPS
jgi:hypothetical protein